MSVILKKGRKLPKLPFNNAKYRPDFAKYERLKREWTAANPDSTPEQYQEAISHIAQNCGI